jgi:hypothetical protein
MLKCVVVCSQGPEHHAGAGSQQDLRASAGHADGGHPEHLRADTAQTEGGRNRAEVRHQRHVRGVWTPSGQIVFTFGQTTVH